MAGMSTKRRR